MKTELSINFNNLIEKNNDTVLKIFAEIKNQNWNEVINIIKSTNIDLNIKDSSNTYLLEYAIIFNQINLINLLLEKKIRIDITDDYNRSILYNIIKFSYIDILINLLEKNKLSIGKSILEIKDNDGNIPLFYSIKFFNLECIKIIIKYTTNFFIKNNDGDNALHLSIKSQNFELFKLIISNFNDIKSRNIIGESYLHLIVKYKCYDMLEFIINKNINDSNFLNTLNFVDFKYNFTILHYITINLDLTSLQILSKFNLLKYIDGNIQDNSGNIFYHYFINKIILISKIDNEIINKILMMNDFFKNINYNINLYNIDGNSASHIFFLNINYFSNNNLNTLINVISEKSDMNIQNFLGESVFYLIVKNNYWEQIYNILITKKIDIFIIANESNTIFDFIDKNKYPKFVKMITQSYLFQLTNSITSKKWLDYWDNRCKKNVTFEELNDTEIELLKSIDLNLTDISNDDKNSNFNLCYKIIEKKIYKSIDNFLENKNNFDYYSFPMSNKFKKIIISYPTVIISTFSGSTIDIMSGLIYLTKKFKQKKNYIITSLNLIKNKSNIIKCTNYKINDIDNKICEINDFEILWINKNIYYPLNLNKIINYNFNNKSDNYRWIIVPIGIELNNFSHANYLIIDTELLEIERFEPHGSKPPIGLNYDSDLLDFILINFLIDSINNPDINFKYFKPYDYLPNIGFQIKEINELKSDFIGDPNGFCAVWCIWWSDLRLSNPEIIRNKLVKYVNSELINGKYSYKKLIRDYSGYITDIRDKLFLKANTNINEWINDIVTDKNIDLLDEIIREEIINLDQ